MTSVPPKSPAAKQKNRLKVIPSRWTRESALVLDTSHKEADLREAVSVSARGDGQQIEIQLGHMCNNVCLFCVSGQMTQQRLAKRVPLESIVAVLEEARARGVSRVTFLGGEPTIQPSFLPALQRALDLGFSDIVIFTNLVRGREPRFLEHVSQMGKFSWRISIQGGNEEAHDLVVGRVGAFAKIEAGLRWLGERGHDLTANACINEDSYRSAPDYVDLVRRHGIRQLHLDMVRPRNTGIRSAEEMEHMLARYSDMAGPLGEMLDRFDAWNPDFEVNIGNLPFCVLPRHAHRIVHGGEDTITVSSDGRGDSFRVWKKYEHQGSDKVHVERCAECTFHSHCRGVPADYATLHGTDELQPITSAQVSALDPRVRRWLETGWRPGREPSKGEGATSPEQSRALLRVVQLARGLKRASPLSGWKFEGVQSTSPVGVLVTLSRDDISLGVKLEARPNQKRPVQVSFELPEGVLQESLRPVIEEISETLRGSGKQPQKVGAID